jgi:drug/metabolite transporter (DMT)-like permease
MTNQRKAYIFALTAILCWSTVATAFKIALRSLDYLNLLFLASLTSVVVLLMVLIIQGKLHLLKKTTLMDAGRSALLGFLNPFLYYTVLLKAYSILPAQLAQPLNYTWPIMLVILSVPFLRQKVGFKSMAGILVSFIGVIAISMQADRFSFANSGDLTGVFLATGSSVVWAFFWIFNVRDKRDEVVKLFLNFLFSLVFIIPVLCFSGFRFPGFQGSLAVLYIGIFEMGLTFVLWLKAMQLTSQTDKIGGLVFISPFVSLILIHFILGEQIFYSTLAGLVLIVAGIVIHRIKL